MRRRSRVLLLALVGAFPACKSDPKVSSTLAVDERDAGVDLRADWKYRSFDVDVDLTLITREREDSCTSTSHLVVNDVVSGADAYDLAATDCTLLRLGPDGDILMDAAPTAHDWTAEDLSVNTDSEVIALGPANGSDPETGVAVAFTFSISAPPCNDGTDCDCGVLRRTGGGAQHVLSLGRVCD